MSSPLPFGAGEKVTARRAYLLCAPLGPSGPSKLSEECGAPGMVGGVSAESTSSWGQPESAWHHCLCIWGCAGVCTYVGVMGFRVPA